MDIEAHGDDDGMVITYVRDWLNTNHADGASVLPGAAAIRADHDAYLKIVPDIITALRLDPHDDLPQGDYLHVVELALLLIEAGRRA